MALEIERKWLVPEFPEALAGVSGERILQGYLVVADDGSEVRVRRNHRREVLTYKSGGGLTRTEVEIGLSPEQFEALWEATEGRRLVKYRHNLEGGVDVDVYDGTLKGLIVAEVEFASEAAAAAFDPPEWFGDEVTEDRAYKNQQLALRGRPPRG
jgi:CYTH domain-containing protein